MRSSSSLLVRARVHDAEQAVHGGRARFGGRRTSRTRTQVSKTHIEASILAADARKEFNFSRGPEGGTQNQRHHAYSMALAFSGVALRRTDAAL